jgi:hypothetical protein
MENVWVCLDCGTRHAESGACRSCGEPLADTRDERVRDLMHDIDQRLADRRDMRARLLAVAIGILGVVAIWFVPGYWTLRSQLFALPIFLDQWILMISVALVVYLIVKRGGRSRFQSN